MIEVRSMQKMAEELKLSLDARGPAQSKLPWYSTAVGGLAGASGGKALAAKYLPKKLQVVGQVGGLLAGTAAGLEGGEAMGRYLDKRKTAEEKIKGPFRTLGEGLLGITAGAGAAFLTAEAAHAALKAVNGKGIHSALRFRALPTLGAATSIGMRYFQNKSLEKMREAHIKKQEARRVSKGI